MKATRCSIPLLLFWLVSLTARAADDPQPAVTNRLTFAARLGFNITGSFKRPAPPVIVPTRPRTTPGGDAYNYDDGYVLTDISGNAGGQTWYWGYDDSTRQISGDTILFSRVTSSAPSSSGSRSQDSEPYPGAELTYSRELGRRCRWHYGVEAAANYMNFGLHDRTSSSFNTTRTTDTYSFTAGTMPQTATPGHPFQGSYEGPGFVIDASPVGSATNSITTTTSIDRRQLDADIWGFRLGPYLETPIGEHLNLSASGGLAVGVISSSMSWRQTVTITGGGTTTTGHASATDLAALWGFYLGADASWRFSDHWSAMGGVQYQNLGTYNHSFSGQSVRLDLSKSLFVALGLSYDF